MPKKRGSQPRRGTRTGVQTNPTAGEESIEQWIDSVNSPVRDDDDRQLQRKVTSSHVKNRGSKITKTPQHHVSMTLPRSDTYEEDDSDKEDERWIDSITSLVGDHNNHPLQFSSTEANTYSKKISKIGGRSSWTSPSDLSRVSTAPPTPKASRDLPDEEDDEQLSTEGHDNDGSDIENALLTQENGDDDDNDDQHKDGVVAQQAEANKRFEKPDLELQDDDFGVGRDDDESDEGDQLAPPVAEDSSDDEERASEADAKAPSRKSSESNIDGLESDHDDFDNDNDEGPGYNLVHDPETPEAVRASRAKKEKTTLERRKAQNKKRKSESDTETEASDNRKTPKPKKGKKRTNTKRRVGFSPQGIPISNRDYRVIPIGAFVEDSPEEEGGPRRSKRARVKPLEYWRGEKMQFGAHNEEGDLGEVFGNMPVVKEIQKANPTPYKKKQQPTNGHGGNKKNTSTGSFSKSNAQEEAFDSRKLRRKYKYMNGEDAYLWDDSNEDTGDQSKCIEGTCRSFEVPRSHFFLFCP
jgi:centromere protein C